MATASIPTSELGAEQYAGLGFAQPVLDDHEVQEDTQWPRSVTETYPAMLNDPHVEGMYRGVMLPIRAYDWWLDPNGSRPEVTDRISASYNLPIGEDGRVDQARAKRRFIFDEHLEDVLRGPGLGHAFFEQVYDIATDDQDHLVAVLRKLAYRPARSILRIAPAPDGGLAFIEVPAAKPSGPTGGSVEIPVDRLVAYVWDREASNWAGRSMLRSLYQPWKLKARVIRAGVIAIERAGGIPIATAPEGSTDAHDAKLLAAMKAMRVGAESGAVLAHGTQLQFANAGGGTQAVEYVRLQNEEMARAWVQMLMMLGTTSSAGLNGGSMAETFADRASLVEVAIANWVCKVFTRHVIEDDVDLNEGPDEPRTPILRYTARGSAVDSLAGAMDDAQAAGALPSESVAAATVKAAAGERLRTRARHATPKVRATAAGDDPADLSQTDFAALQARFEEALAASVAAWDTQRKALIDDLVAQVQAASSPADLAAITATAPDAGWLTGILDDVIDHGAETVRAEAAAQGHTLADADLADARATVAATAEGKATLLARSLSQSAASRALGVGVGALSPDEAAAQVREHLEGLAGADADYELKGAVSTAQNTGRFTQMREAPDATRFYASAVNDTNACGPCSETDGVEYPSIDELERDFPGLGGYVGCEGGERCRCTGVMVLPEAAPSA